MKVRREDAIREIAAVGRIARQRLAALPDMVPSADPATRRRLESEVAVMLTRLNQVIAEKIRQVRGVEAQCTQPKANSTRALITPTGVGKGSRQ